MIDSPKLKVELEKTLQAVQARTERSKHSVNIDVLTIPLFSRAGVFFNLVPVPASSNYNWFKKCK
jgi:hypothetical protein